MTRLFLPPQAAARLVEQSGNLYRPKEIVDLKEEIDRRMRLAEFRELNGLLTDEQLLAEAHEIVQLKLKLDDLYCLWGLGKIS